MESINYSSGMGMEEDWVAEWLSLLCLILWWVMGWLASQGLRQKKQTQREREKTNKKNGMKFNGMKAMKEKKINLINFVWFQQRNGIEWMEWGPKPSHGAASQRSANKSTKPIGWVVAACGGRVSSSLQQTNLPSSSFNCGIVGQQLNGMKKISWIDLLVGYGPEAI